jgi:hypothetical protein
MQSRHRVPPSPAAEPQAPTPAEARVPRAQPPRPFTALGPLAFLANEMWPSLAALLDEASKYPVDPDAIDGPNSAEAGIPVVLAALLRCAHGWFDCVVNAVAQIDEYGDRWHGAVLEHMARAQASVAAAYWSVTLDEEHPADFPAPLMVALRECVSVWGVAEPIPTAPAVVRLAALIAEADSPTEVGR